MRLTSSAFKHGEAIPARFTCDGENVSPDFSWHELPKTAKSLVLILHDPDAQRANGFYHWVIYNIPPSVTGLREGVPKEQKAAGMGLQGRNDGGQLGYTGPCPPSGNHRYFVRLYALRQELELPAGVDAGQVQRAMEHSIIEQTELMGTYERPVSKRPS